MKHALAIFCLLALCTQMHAQTGSIRAITSGWRTYEHSNHLHNVLTQTTDKKLRLSSGGSTTLQPAVAAQTDYFAFGMAMPGRTSISSYRFGFNAKEQDAEAYGNGNLYNYGFRIYNPRLGRFLSRDPLAPNYPWYTPYQFAGNKPIAAIDLDGLEEYIVMLFRDKNGTIMKVRIVSAYNSDGGRLSLDMAERDGQGAPVTSRDVLVLEYHADASQPSGYAYANRSTFESMTKASAQYSEIAVAQNKGNQKETAISKDVKVPGPKLRSTNEKLSGATKVTTTLEYEWVDVPDQYVPSLKEEVVIYDEIAQAFARIETKTVSDLLKLTEHVKERLSRDPKFRYVIQGDARTIRQARKGLIKAGVDRNRLILKADDSVEGVKLEIGEAKFVPKVVKVEGGKKRVIKQ